MKQELIAEYLRSHGLRITQARMRLVEIFLSRKNAFESADLEKEITGNHDRSSLFRNLQAFIKAGILHRIPMENGDAFYALCENALQETSCNNDHPHFTCTQCARVFCLPQVNVPPIKGLPSGYAVESSQLFLKGVCDKCRQRKSHGPERKAK